ncbi:hypothetical protein HIM_01693 [Hirsutella minnesotensis 3608]|nr:hypothetical protein HIM_01693 [Hirsutella minnesotensis 3608]
MKSAVAAALVALMAAAEAKDGRTFAVLRFNNKQLTKGRIDPLRNPGETAPHVHNILGGSAFSTTSTGKDLAHSKCTTAKVKGDNSNYWFPSLYFKDPKTGKLEDVELFYANAYYFFESTNDQIKAFPLGLGMISGDVDTRSPPAGGSVTNLDPSKGPVNPVKWTCPRDGNRYDPPSWPANSDGKLAGIGDPINKGEGVGFPDVNCDGYASPLRADIHFPSCYNPEIGLTDYKKNMVFPSDSGNGKLDCPKGHIHVPHLFLEVYWNTPAFKDRWEQNKGSQPFVLSNGDATGFSLHADFMAGWDEKVLQTIIDTCDAGTLGMDKCPNLPYGLTEGDCTIESSINEKIDGPLDALPGKNPVTGWAFGGGDRVKPSHGEPDNSRPFPGDDKKKPPPSSDYKPAPSDIANYPEQKSDAPAAVQNPAVQPTKAHADQAPAATSVSSQCVPVTVTVQETTTIYQTITAGGQHPATPVAIIPGPVSHAEAPKDAAPEPSTPSGVPNGAGAEPKDEPETPSAPIPAPIPQPSAPAADKADTSPYPQPAQPVAPAPHSNSTLTVAGFQHAGCFKDTNERALRGVIRANLDTMTNEKCVSHCKTAGYALAGTEYGGQCYCGNELVGSQQLDHGKCDMPCEGNSKEMCGGSWALSVYSKEGQASLKGTKCRRHLHDHVRRHRTHYL